MSTDINQVLRDWQARSIGIMESVVGIKPDSASRMSFLGAHATYVEFTAPDGRHGHISWEGKAYEISIAPKGSNSFRELGDGFCTLSDAVDAVIEEVMR